MVHRDVKSTNVLLQRDDEGRVVRAVLADFGLARFHSHLNESGGSVLAASSMTAVVGTHGYVDPLYAEVLYIFNMVQLMQCLLIIFHYHCRVQPADGPASFRPVMSFTLEGHPNHYFKRAMQWCRGWVRTGCSASPIEQCDRFNRSCRCQPSSHWKDNRQLS